MVGVIGSTANAGLFANLTGGSLPQNVNYAVKVDYIYPVLGTGGDVLQPGLETTPCGSMQEAAEKGKGAVCLIYVVKGTP